MSTPSLPPERIVYQEHVPGARYASLILRRGFALRLTDVDGTANAAVLLYNPHNLLERYNAPDTLKGQHTARLTAGHMLYSDMGRVMLSITADSLDWHDPIGGISDADAVRGTYGQARYQERLNDFHRSGRELFLIELAKWGLGRADLLPNVNFFSKVQADEAGNLRYRPGHSHAGACVDLRAEMDTLIILQTAPHPMAPGPEYAPGAVDLTVYRAEPVAAEDPCLVSHPENARAYANTAAYHSQE
ncbi:urea amidolyase associated protein UAAP1 [Halorhodospira sp. 9622]|uniref:urea amidolyase associated protein UAAP1 n=1 Tax=Halorhodospira sp. 9622 TaxID=2899136 RepID=UPI001EE8B541|nr:urea amidolyase associated protein UAAP1 [Halorhodospira sp. 9622]MCG5538051.1 urea carboxylase-associated family protein [Halorhodospira sp. 9622]